MKLIQLLKTNLLLEYSDKLINTMLGIYAPQTEDSEEQIKHNIKRFEQLTNAIASRLGKNPAVDAIIPDELKINNKFRDITQYRDYNLLLKVIKAVDTKPVDKYKQAIEFYKKQNKYQDPRVIGNYVARFKSNLDNLIEKVEDKDLNALNVISKKLLQKDAYKNILNWYSFHELEIMLDTVFPIESDFEGGDNDAMANGDLIYDKDDLEIFKGDSETRCVYYTKKYKKSYPWCIGNTMYSNYRYMQHNADLNRMFYFIFDRTLPTTDRYHAVVLHAYAGGGYTRTTSVNGDETQPKSWKELANLFQDEPSGIKVWNKIKNLENLFQFIQPSRDEQRRVGFRGQNLTLEQFVDMDPEDKLDWLRANAIDRGIVTPEIVKTLPTQGELSRNELINYDRLFTFNELKDSAPLVKRYAEYRFSRYPNEHLPIIFLPYLKEDSKLRYYNEFFDKDNDDSASITFEYALKYFGESIASNYVNKQIKKLAYVPESAFKYINDPKLKSLYKVIHKLYKNWDYDSNTNLSDERLELEKSMPASKINPKPLTYNDWKELKSEERKIILEISKKYATTTNPDYEFIKYAIPYVIKNGNTDLILLPKELNIDDIFNIEYKIWILTDVDANIVKIVNGEDSEISDEFNNGIDSYVSDILNFNKYLDLKTIKLKYGQSNLKENKYKLLNYIVI